MNAVIQFIVQGASLGFSASISPGPLFFYLMSQSLLGGWKRGAVVAFAPLVSDAPLIIVVLLFLDHLPIGYLRIISLAGGFYLIYLAWSLFHNWRKKQGLNLDEGHRFTRNLGQAVLVNYLSPGPYLFWVLVNGPLLLQAIHLSAWHGIGFVVSFYGIFIGCMLILAGIFSQARRLSQRMRAALSLMSLIILNIFGCILIIRGFQGIF